MYTKFPIHWNYIVFNERKQWNAAQNLNTFSYSLLIALAVTGNCLVYSLIINKSYCFYRQLRTRDEFAPPDILGDCLSIQSLHPMSHGDSPLELNDSGIGRSPHSSCPASAELYPGRLLPVELTEVCRFLS